MDYSNIVMQKLKSSGIRVEIDDRSEKIGKKIRDTELMKVPYMLVIGEKEMNDGMVSVRRQGKGDTGIKLIDEFISDLSQEIINRIAD
jgi:threonyl-tRNA synthetase